MWAHEADHRTFFAGDEDRRRLLALLREAAREHRVRCLGWCLMGNHYHLVLLDPEGALSAAMHRVHSAFARHRRLALGTPGPVLRSRFGSKFVVSDEHLLTVVRYVARNPVHHGAASDPAAWRWSSHAAVLRGEPDGLVDHAALLGRFGPDPALALRAYADLVTLPGPRFEAPPPGVPVALLPPRPSLAELREALDVRTACRTARAWRYTLPEISQAFGLSPHEVRSCS